LQHVEPSIDMKRRDFLALLAGLAGWPAGASAQERVRNVAILSGLAGDDLEINTFVQAFQDELRKSGWEEGRNIRIEYRPIGSDPNRLQPAARELLQTMPDACLAIAPTALVTLSRETRSVPIVFVQVSDPVKLGFVASLARPGGNITGFANFEHPIGGKWLDLLKDTAPGRNRVAVLLDPDNPSQGAYWQGIESAAPSFKVQLVRVDVRNATDIERSIVEFAQQPNGALIVVPNALTIGHRNLVIALAKQYRLPAVYPYRFFTASGGLISYGINLPDVYRQAASYVDRILKGAKAGELPVQLASKFELIVNLKTANALGLTIPEPFLQQADEVIE
jgi:putative ABC transport system substrate-binding protein